MNKYEKYRRSCVQRGLCPHCGKPCAPFFECAERRAYKRQQYKKREREKDRELIEELQGWMIEDGLHLKNYYIQARSLICFLMPLRKPVPSRICEITGWDFFFVKATIDNIKKRARVKHGIRYDWLDGDLKSELVGKC